MIESSCWKHAKLLDFIQLSGEMLEITKLVKQTERKKMRERKGERERGKVQRFDTFGSLCVHFELSQIVISSGDREGSR